uniref:Large ribosomal subunit protein mL45 n=1 Tax=Auxenochlorella protothecoides TaxID=3075 RepID=A0A1D2A4S9_AUXPR
MAALPRLALRACSHATHRLQGAPPCSAPAAFTSLLRLAQHATCPSGSYQPTRGYAGQEYLANKFPKGAFAASQTLGRPAGFRPSVVTSDHVFDPYQGVPSGLSAATMLTPKGLKYLWRRAKGSAQNVYALAMAHKYAKPFKMPLFKQEALRLYEEVNTHVAAGDRRALIALTAPNVNTTFKRQIKAREDAGWTRVEWALVNRPTAENLSVVQGRAAMGDPKDPNTGFVQFTIRFNTKQRFRAFSKSGAVVAGGPDPVDVEELWVVEHPFKKQETNRWRLVGKLMPVPGTKEYTSSAPVITSESLRQHKAAQQA